MNRGQYYLLLQIIGQFEASRQSELRFAPPGRAAWKGTPCNWETPVPSCTFFRESACVGFHMQTLETNMQLEVKNIRVLQSKLSFSLPTKMKTDSWIRRKRTQRSPGGDPRRGCAVFFFVWSSCQFTSGFDVGKENESSIWWNGPDRNKFSNIRVLVDHQWRTVCVLDQDRAVQPYWGCNELSISPGWNGDQVILQIAACIT